MPKRILVAGGGGFIGLHMVRYLKRRGCWVRAVDIQRPEFCESEADEFLLLDLRRRENSLTACEGMREVYQLAADMGGIGYISSNHVDIASNNVLINAHMLEAASLSGVERFFFSSSACVYPQYRQEEADVTPLAEEDAYPAAPEEGYGWEKLYAEKLCQYYQEEGRMQTRVARFHNVYGPLGCYEGGREKAPAALCRKVALARSGDDIEVWGDGEQTRSFMYIDDCVEGIFRIMASDHSAPLNLGTDERVTINELVDLIAAIAGKRLAKQHDGSRPQGVRGRNSDNGRIRAVLGWEPRIPIREGLARTYPWIEAELARAGRLPEAARPTVP